MGMTTVPVLRVMTTTGIIVVVVTLCTAKLLYLVFSASILVAARTEGPWPLQVLCASVVG
jgi:hypothetical protein